MSNRVRTMRSLGLAVLSVCAAQCGGAPDPSGTSAEELAGKGHASLSGGALPIARYDFSDPEIRAISGPRDFTDLSDGTSPHGMIRTDFTPSSRPPIVDDFSLRVRHMGPGFAAATPITWDVGQLTGFHPPAPQEAWQLGDSNADLPIGANAYQLQGTTAGALINTWSFDHTQPIVGGGPHVVYSIDYSHPETPFRAPTSALTLQANVRLPWATSWSGGIGQLSFFVYLRDKTTSAVFAYVMGIWDSRAFGDGNGTEFIGNDTQTYFVSSPLLAGQKYTALSPYSAPMRNQITWTGADFFRVHVFAQQMVDAASAIEAQSGATLSKNATDYELMSAGILQEVFVGTDPAVNMSMGASYTGFAVYEFTFHERPTIQPVPDDPNARQ